MKKLWIALMVLGGSTMHIVNAAESPISNQKPTFRQRVSSAKTYLGTKARKAKKVVRERLPQRRSKKTATPASAASSSAAMDQAFKTVKQDYPDVFDAHQPHGLNMANFLAAIKPLREQGVSNHPLYTISLYMGTLDKIAAEEKKPTHPLVLSELQRLKGESAQKLSYILTHEQIAALPPLSQASSAPSASWKSATPSGQWKKGVHPGQKQSYSYTGGHRQTPASSSVDSQNKWHKAAPKQWRQSASVAASKPASSPSKEKRARRHSMSW